VRDEAVGVNDARPTLRPSSRRARYCDTIGCTDPSSESWRSWYAGSNSNGWDGESANGGSQRGALRNKTIEVVRIHGSSASTVIPPLQPIITMALAQSNLHLLILILLPFRPAYEHHTIPTVSMPPLSPGEGHKLCRRWPLIDTECREQCHQPPARSIAPYPSISKRPKVSDKL
jgi:hypothetical protein